MQQRYGPDESGFDPAASRRSFRLRVRPERWSSKVQEIMVSIVGVVWAVAIVMIAQLGLRSFGFGSDSVAIRHLVAATGCGAAREVGLAPAHRGDPGYWARLDADHDGVSCEPIVLPHRLRTHRR